MRVNRQQNVIIPIALSLGIFFSLFILAVSNQPATARITGDSEVSVIATSLYLDLEDNNGAINGGVTRAGYEDWIEVLSYSHSIHVPYDAASGQVTGARQHSPFRVTKSIDKATPLLYNALASSNLMTKFELRLLGPSSTGQELHYFSVELTNARIVSIQTSASTAPSSNVAVETVSFIYTRITWTWIDGGITAQDDWVEVPV